MNAEPARRLPAPEPVEVVSDPNRAALLLDVDRRRIVGALATEPDSASGLARRLGDSRQRLNYHLRTLEDAGFVELVEERKKGNCVERIVRATARHYLIDPDALGPLSVADIATDHDQFSATYLIAWLGRALRDLARLKPGAARARKRLATFTAHAEVRLARPADMQAFSSDLARAVARVITRHHDEESRGGHRFQVLVGAYPTLDDPKRGQQNDDRKDER